VIGGIHYAFIALERVGGCIVFNVENPSAPIFVTYVNNRTLNGSGPDLGAEGIIFIPSENSPNGQNIVILANEVSSTLSIYSASNCTELAYYADLDNDGFGDATEILMACEQPAGYVLDNSDCNDLDALINPNTVWYLDADDDGFYVSSVTQCLQPAQGYTIAQSILGDCDDSNSSVNSLATEVCNAIDDDCDSQINEGVVFLDYYVDQDSDTFGNGSVLNACAQPLGYVANNTDCDDTNSSVNSSSTEVCNGIDDDCDNSIDEGVQTSYYLDTDTDGFGLGNQVLLCTQTVGYVMNNLDCNDSNSAVNPNATESCVNSIDDDCDGLINEGCVSQLIGENFTNPQSIAVAFWPNCSSTNHTLVGYAPSVNAQSVCITGEDKWHQFVANSEAVSIQVNSTANDIIIELQTAAGILIAFENAVNGIGNEILNVGGLTAGQVYKVAVRNYNSALGIGAYSICVKSLRRGGCDSGNSPQWSNNLNLCNIYKATWAGPGTQYRFNFTGITGIATGNTYTRTQSSDLLPLSTVQPTLPLGSAYQVHITNIYTLQNGLGETEVLEVSSLTPCTLLLQQAALTSLRSQDRCENGPKFRSGVVYSMPWVCGVNNWKWQFTLVDAGLNPIGLPITHYRNAASNGLNLGTVPGLQAGQTYAVRTAPSFSWGDADFGPSFYMCIVGISSIETIAQQESSEKQLIQTDFDFALIPNPASSDLAQIQISGLQEESKVWFTITNDLGQQITSFSKLMHNNEIYNLKEKISFSPGLYLIEAMVNNVRTTHRLVILN
ncbi:MAG: MopE-related protein, partial [Bacteroidota bacterium]